MGGLSTAVTDESVDIFFEAAFWPPEYIAGRARSYGLHTDASLRFERGVDPEGTGRAMKEHLDTARRSLVEAASVVL